MVRWGWEFSSFSLVLLVVRSSVWIFVCFVLLCLFASGLVFPRKTRSAAPQSVFTARKGDRSTPGVFNWMTFSNAAPSFANACHPTHPDPPERLHRPPSKGDVPGWTGRCIDPESQMVFAQHNKEEYLSHIGNQLQQLPSDKTNIHQNVGVDRNQVVSRHRFPSDRIAHMESVPMDHT